MTHQDASEEPRDGPKEAVGAGDAQGLSRVLLVVASVVYLVVEVVFNMSLLEAVSATRIEALHDVEEFGRMASASGFTLAVLGLFLSTGFMVRGAAKWTLFVVVVLVCAYPFVATPYHQWVLLPLGLGATITAVAAFGADKRASARRALSLGGVVLMAWPAFYHGKPAVVNHYVVDPSSGEERLAAGYITLLRRALIADVVQLEDLTLEGFGGAGSPEAKAFLVMLGPLALSAESLLSWAGRPDNVEGLARSLASSRRVVDVEREYAEYERLRGRFLDQLYAPYEAASKRYIERGAELEERARAAWLEMQIELDEGWTEYQTAQSEFIAAYVDLVRRQRVVDRYLRFVENMRQCRSADQCRRYERGYYEEMRRISDPPPDWRIFCDEQEPPKRNRGLESIGRVLRGGDVLDVFRDVRRINTEEDRVLLVCAPSDETFATRLAYHDRGKFVALPANRARLPMALDRAGYFGHPGLAEFTRGELQSRHGVALPPSWTVMDQAGFYEAFRVAGEAEAEARLRRALSALGDGPVKVGLGVREFERLPFVQARLRDMVGDDYFPGFTLMFSERQFAERIIRPRIEAAVEAELEAFREGAAQYEDGGKLEDVGKDQLRFVLVPPIAVALSLLFAFVSLAKVSSSLLTPLVTRRDGWPRNVVGFLLWVAPIAAMVALPFLVTNSYAQSKAWSLLSEQAASRSPATAVMSEYVMRVQPIFAVVGYPMLAVFDPYGLGPEPEALAQDPDAGRTR